VFYAKTRGYVVIASSLQAFLVIVPIAKTRAYVVIPLWLSRCTYCIKDVFQNV
jgi:hypothetical protein